MASWLSHYCQLKCIDEIVIQDQNWSTEDTLFLLRTVAAYVDEYHKKIVVLPSAYKRIEGESKRTQFITYGQPAIRNRVQQFLQEDTWIMGAIDEVIYGSSYEDTDDKLKLFEDQAEERAKEGLNTIGFFPLWLVDKDGSFYLYAETGYPWKPKTEGETSPLWMHRVYRFAVPFSCRGQVFHDHSLYALTDGEWRKVTPPDGVWTKNIAAYGFPVDLKLIHYHTLVRPSVDSKEYIMPTRDSIKNPEEHPPAYLYRLVTNPLR